MTVASTETTGVAKLRRATGPLGLWTTAFEAQPAGPVQETVAELEELRWGAIWFGEAFGRDTVSQSWLVLSATRRLTVASGIANIAFRDPVALVGAERALHDAFPGRYLLGLGGHRVDDTVHHVDGYRIPGRGRPVAAMRAYLDSMDAVPAHGPAPVDPPARVLAALGPRMMALAGERTLGAHPYFVPVEHTARAREILGPDSYLAVEQAVVLDQNRDRARELATAHVAGYLVAPHQQRSLRTLGFTDADLDAAAPSRRLVDAIVAYGDLAAVERRVADHLAAGADHVCLQVLTADPTALPLTAWRELAPALLGRFPNDGSDVETSSGQG
ncbi:TIGR03620 family F420-dependent LLM class oxidoreductase [Streptomyces sp. 3MP-14]|uniref:TIGR03620 family F420-dependent LLM class oxidoreductase n=1 Tax=Streptomyces mimosae TaxID=2586635 RepID=A0A5N6AID4_9ACTN|nr:MULTISPECIES: TIGR03620 family F420-dependent LLM class oxidoreductase [Streptomyces]KAB8168597.1 TIGR03620 family F420-dependent LLM class oxidoreductase [Streptomyces mimosae]KAB8178123.1 TIGR03620 family F420-dependent LLM class oxidoreductase [Streptomyces sp. 3MP-14]